MKTDLVEIFQVIRASIQPYATLGFAAIENSETEYQLFTEKQQEHKGQKAVFFAGVSIEDSYVVVCLFNDVAEIPAVTIGDWTAVNGCFKVNELEEHHTAEIETALSEAYKVYKEKGWV